jgi:hypothetical protein
VRSPGSSSQMPPKPCDLIVEVLPLIGRRLAITVATERVLARRRASSVGVLPRMRRTVQLQCASENPTAWAASVIVSGPSARRVRVADAASGRKVSVDTDRCREGAHETRRRQAGHRGEAREGLGAPAGGRGRASSTCPNSVPREPQYPLNARMDRELAGLPSTAAPPCDPVRLARQPRPPEGRGRRPESVEIDPARSTTSWLVPAWLLGTAWRRRIRVM